MSGGPLLLDTGIILVLVRGKELGKRLSSQFNLESAVHRPLISIVTLGEIWALADQFSFGASKREFLKDMLATLVVVDISHDSVIDAYVEVDRACRKAKGGARTLSKNDLWIAASTIAAGATLVTTDRDFLCLHPQPCPVHYIDQGSGMKDEPA